uniref:BHLH domain-containing protein n=1 Tax=Leersia perrieri TaxID=77586 RepID=A0A0D9WWT1_9ORYZ
MAAGEALQAVAKSLRWTYSLLWHICPHQGGALVWAEGHYNGAVKTRKTTVMPSPEEDGGGGGEHAAARHRSRQLRELYDWLAAAGETTATASGGGGRRPSAALSPEDLTETEWFFLMSASYCFPSGVGLPGRAFAMRGHVWLTGANEVDSKVFLRAILAKTVVCIPVVDGVLEIGTTEKVKEDIGLIQYARSIFMDQHGIHMMPTLSEHSTSNPVTHIHQHPIQMQIQTGINQTKMDSDELNPKEENDETEEEGMSFSDTNIDTARNSGQLQDPLNMVSNDQTMPNHAVSSDLMQCEMSEVLRDGLDEEIQMLMDYQNSNGQLSLQGPDEPCHSWHVLCEELQNDYHPAAEDQVTSPENSHYPKTLFKILQYNAHRQQELNIMNYLPVSEQSSFSRWSPKGTDDNHQVMISQGTTQRMLKCILMIVPSSHCSYREDQTPESRGGKGASGSRKVGAVQGDFSGNHVMKERRRREKLNEKFIILRSLVPFMTKMDKASILGDTIEYVKQLRKRIQDLESSSSSSRPRNPSSSTPASSGKKRRTTRATTSAAATAATEAGSSSNGVAGETIAAAEAVVQVSIIESDALVELRCSGGGDGDGGVLLRVMKALQGLHLDVTAVQASTSPDGVLLADLRAKVKKVRGRRSSSIAQVKRTIHLVLSSSPST